MACPHSSVRDGSESRAAPPRGPARHHPALEHAPAAGATARTRPAPSPGAGASKTGIHPAPPIDRPRSIAIVRRPARAPVAELVDALDSKSSSARSAGSIPARGTIPSPSSRSRRRAGCRACFAVLNATDEAVRSLASARMPAEAGRARCSSVPLDQPCPPPRLHRARASASESALPFPCGDAPAHASTSPGASPGKDDWAASSPGPPGRATKARRGEWPAGKNGAAGKAAFEATTGRAALAARPSRLLMAPNRTGLFHFGAFLSTLRREDQ